MPLRARRMLLCIALFFVAINGRLGDVRAAEPLPSWNEGPTRTAIVDFVSRVTKEGGPDFVPVSERLAVFDNDGTLWSEQPNYFQAFFMFDRIKALAPQHPEWKDTEPFASALKGDVKGALAGGRKSLDELMIAAHAGMSTDEFTKIVNDWMATARHPRFNRPFSDCVFQPMLELLAYLRANGFKTYIVSGGGIDFMRPWTEKVYGVPPEQVVGSSLKMMFEFQGDKSVIVKMPAIDFIDDGPNKPVGIERFIGRRPIMAFGNSDGDLQMLQWTTTGDRARFGLIVHHTDAESEWAYDRQSNIGKLDKALDDAGRRGWTVVDMKQDWKVIYPFER